jgi:S1-C subfamily serine protease
VVVVGISDERARELELDAGQGLLVQRTEPGTIAGVLGIGAGDVLAEINGRPIHSRDDIGAVLRERKDGEEVSVTWYDGAGHKRTRTWREGEAAKQPAGGADGAPSHPLRAPKQDV